MGAMLNGSVTTDIILYSAAMLNINISESLIEVCHFPFTWLYHKNITCELFIGIHLTA